MLWVSLIMTFIRGQSLLGKIDGTTPKPANLIEKIAEKPGTRR